MRKALLLSISFLLSTLAFCQNVVDRKVNFEYIRLPLQPLNKSIQNYQSYVVLEYEADIKARKDAYAKSVDDAEKKYQADNADYDKKVKDAGVRYAQDMAAYKVNQKTQPDAKEPVLTLPPKPERVIPVDNNYYPKVFNQESLSSNLSLDGYKKYMDYPVKVTALLKGFQYTEPQLKMNEVSKTKDGVTYKEKEYYYEVSYKHPMGLKVETPGEGVVYNQNLEELNQYSVYRTDKYKTEAEATAAFNKTQFFNSVEDKIVASNLKVLNDVLNNQFGFTKLGVMEEFSLVQGKKYSYADYQQAFEATTLGLGQLSADVKRTVASQNLNSAVGIWENALKESQPDNKKARINGSVTTATMFNIALACIYANEFGKAEIYLNKIYASDAKKREQRKVDRFKSFMKDQQSRYEAYNR